MSTQLIGVPQMKSGDVLILNGTVFTLVAPGEMFGYADTGWAITTSGVALERRAETVVARLMPWLAKAIVRLLHSLKSMTPLPLPPEIVMKSRFTPGKSKDSCTPAVV